VALAADAESVGFEHLWVADSPAIWRELWTTLGAVAARTRRMRLGSAVTTGVTRHPAVTASAALGLAELTGGRFDLGLGNGDSSLLTTGGTPQSLRDFRESVETLRRLLDGEAARAVRIGWAAGPRVPIYVAASGPRMLDLAGALADGVIMMVGVADTMVRAAIDRVHAGARAAGRKPEDVDVVVWTACAVSDAAPQAAVVAVKATVARTLMRRLPRAISAAHRATVERIRAAYDYTWHSVPARRMPHSFRTTWWRTLPLPVTRTHVPSACARSLLSGCRRWRSRCPIPRPSIGWRSSDRSARSSCPRCESPSRPCRPIRRCL